MEPRTYSVCVRLRRTKVEYAFVSVPVDSNVMEEDPDDSSKVRLSGTKVYEEARRLGKNDPNLLWTQESESLIEIHPLQTPPPGT